MSRQKKIFPVQLKESTERKFVFEVPADEDTKIYYGLIAGCAKVFEKGAKCSWEGNLIKIEFQNETNAKRLRDIWDQPTC